MTVTQFCAGRMLVAVSGLRDPNFLRTVVFICEHDASGAFGLVINRPGKLVLGEALPTLAEEPLGALNVAYGGPVQPEALFYLHGDQDLPGRPVIDGVQLGGDEEGLRALTAAWAMENPPRCRLFAGYSGWGPGQLEFELSQEAWVTAPADADLVFGEPELLWKRVLGRLGGRWALMGQTPPDPDLN